METQKAVFGRSVHAFRVVHGWGACGVWWSVWKPYVLCGARGGFMFFGELVRLSGIIAFRGGLLHIGKP